MSEEKKGEERGFTVVDRRAGAEAKAAPEAAQSEEGPPLPGVDFSSLCLSLATSALYHLGVVSHPETQQPIAEVELPMARQTIDTLEMLELKTRGNLEPDEAKLLESLLYELRMHFVEASKAGGSPPGDSGG